VADDVSPGELDRRLAAHEARTDRVHAELDNRIASLAKDMVPLQLYQRGERDRDREIQHLGQEHDTDMAQVRGDIKELRERPAMTVGRWMAVLSVVAAFLTLGVMAYGTLQGAK
jgi:hypothetical protein